MATIIPFSGNGKPTPPVQKNFCTDCKHHQGSVAFGYCKAIGGEYAVLAYRKCNGNWWEKKKGLITRIKEYFS